MGPRGHHVSSAHHAVRRTQAADLV